jgi:hypothetical protein
MLKDLKIQFYKQKKEIEQKNLNIQKYSTRMARQFFSLFFRQKSCEFVFLPKVFFIFHYDYQDSRSSTK